MKLITNDHGFEEIEIADSAEFADFYRFAEYLTEIAGVYYSSKIDDYDSLYWIFNIEDVGMVLHYNIYMGICIYLSKTIDANPEERATLQKLFGLLTKV